MRIKLICLLLASKSLCSTLPHKQSVWKRDAFVVNNYAALGDSFASGPGAGNFTDDSSESISCKRYNLAHGRLVSLSDQVPGVKNFTFVACSGAKMQNVNGSSSGSNQPSTAQADRLKGLNPEMVTLSISGNDAGFVDILDKCIYRFGDVFCLGCGFPSFDDCTNNCNAAITKVAGNIQQTQFKTSLVDTFESIFANAPKTILFVTGYPQFFNDQTTQCNGATFKAFCKRSDSKLILPLIQARRTAINNLTTMLNGAIQSAVSSAPHSSQIVFVDTNPFFENHRFCEEGVDEPSYKNPDIWFFPFTYSSTNTNGSNYFDPSGLKSGDCNAILNGGGDWGDYIGCEVANTVLAGNPIDLSNQTNNLPPSTTNPSIAGSSGWPDIFARIFHPDLGGHEAYASAIISAYSSATPVATTTTTTIDAVYTTTAPAQRYSPGTCSFHLTETQTCDDDTSNNLFGKITLYDNAKNVIGSTPDANNGMGPAMTAKNPLILDSALPYTVVATGENRGDYVQFAYFGLSWKSTDKTGNENCSQGGWTFALSCELGSGSPITRDMDCSFPC